VSTLRFTEEMDGFVSFDPAGNDFERGRRHGRAAGTAAMFHLTIDVDDDAAFLADPEHAAAARGWVKIGGPLGDVPLPVTDGVFNLFRDGPDERRREMRYRLPFTGPDGRALVLAGEKHVQDDPGFDLWRDTTTLFTELRDATTDERLAIGILRLTAGDFARQMTTLRANGGGAPARFGAFFATTLWEVYGKRALPGAVRRPPAPRTPPLELDERIVPYTTEDGFTGHLVNVRAAGRDPHLGPVYMAAGSSVRTNVFRAPTSENIVERLAREGYDVWLNEWRASIVHPRNPWSLDEGALYDHPEGVRTVVRETGAEKVKALVHCQGSTSFFMGLVSGLIPEVDTVVCNAVSLHPVVPPRSKLKIVGLTPVMGRFTEYVDVSWGINPETWLARCVRAYVRATHRECDNLVCQVSSFFYGHGSSTMWDHAKLSPETHDWLTDEFEWIPVRFFAQIRRSILRGQLVWDRPHDGVPPDLCAQPPQTDARITFLQGTANRCFAPESQARTFAWFDEHQPGRHRLRELRGYGHFDCWMGDDAPRDVHPVVLDALNIVPSTVTPTS
jgi:hypothetical protein